MNASKEYKERYLLIYENLLPEIVKEVCPEIAYVPSSPSSCGHFIDPNNENYGDSHYWEVWHNEKPFTEYRKHFFRYLSEFGFESMPNEKTVNSFTLPSDRNIFSRVMEMHQRNKAANGKIMNYMAQTYLYPGDFETLLYASQLLQAEAIRYGVEHFRRYRGRWMGAVVWQLNDIWPVASWASIDYYGRWKALHYAEKKMFAPILLSCEETGELSERPFCITERKKSIEKSVRFHVANETWKEFTGSIEWELRTPDAAISGILSVTAPSFDGVFLEKIDFSDKDERGVYVSYRLRNKENTVVSEGTTLFTPPKHFKFENPELSFTVEGKKITVSSRAYAKSVEIVALDGDVRFSDNYFDLNGDSKTVEIVEGNAASFKVRSVYDIR